MDTKVSVSDLCYRIDGKEIITDICMKIKKGSFVGIIGPNGSGKSTILRNIYRAVKPDKGTIFLDGVEIQTFSFKETAKRMAVLRQESVTDFDYSVQEMVKMGRTPHHGLFDPDTEEDARIVSESLKRVGMEVSADRMLSTLSGGEKQRVLIARALAQETDFILLDEPTNHLDIYYKLQVMELVKSLDITVLAVIHDLDLASKYCDYLYVLHDGKIFLQGKPVEVFTKEMFESVFKVYVDITHDEKEGIHQITYLGIVQNSTE
ncbi:MAG: ABC transporter ATP-binding protein [Eubacteriales bacterium]|nr:ABC transporter ATP-binding protein [Eubacteriales bacterium]